MRLLVLGTYRDSELSHSHPFLETLAAMRRFNGAARIELTGLDDSGVVSLMEARAGHDLDDDSIALAHAVYRETDGNPFFVGEILRHLAETGAIPSRTRCSKSCGPAACCDPLNRLRRLERVTSSVVSVVPSRYESNQS
jgi:predicted ATPase